MKNVEIRFFVSQNQYIFLPQVKAQAGLAAVFHIAHCLFLSKCRRVCCLKIPLFVLMLRGLCNMLHFLGGGMKFG